MDVLVLGLTPHVPRHGLPRNLSVVSGVILVWHFTVVQKVELTILSSVHHTPCSERLEVHHHYRVVCYGKSVCQESESASDYQEITIQTIAYEKSEFEKEIKEG